MNVLKDNAGCVTHKHIKKKGFKVFNTIEGYDYSLPQYENYKFQIVGGYWNWIIKDVKTGQQIWSGWWNSNDEFDKTILELETFKSE
jgi:hypothetical protein